MRYHQHGIHGINQSGGNDDGAGCDSVVHDDQNMTVTIKYQVF